MSGLEIDHGFRLPFGLDECLARMTSWQETYTQQYRDAVSSYLAREAARIIDLQDAQDLFDTGHSIPLREQRIADLVFNELEENMQEGVYPHTSLCPDAKLTVFPHAEGLFGIVTGGNIDVLNQWMLENEVENFSYTDSVLPAFGDPDCVTEEAWWFRKKLWSEIFESSAQIYDAGLTIQIISDNPLTRMAAAPWAIAEHMPEMKDRVTEVAYPVVTDRYRSANPAGGLTDLKQYLSSEEGADQLKDVICECLPVLRPEITKDDLSQPYARFTPAEMWTP